MADIRAVSVKDNDQVMEASKEEVSQITANIGTDGSKRICVGYKR